jgi:hypothetical protein
VTNLGCLFMTLRQSSSSLRGRLQIHCDRRKHDKLRAMSNLRWFVFLTLKASCTRNFFNQDIVNEKIYWDILRGLREITRSIHPNNGTTSPGPIIMMRLWLMHRLLCSSLWLLRRWQSSPTIPNHQTSPRNLFLFPKMKLMLKGRCFDST